MTAPERPSSRVRPRVTHTCLCGCGRRIAHNRILCVDAWTRVPEDLRRRAKDLDEQFYAAMCAILDWAREHPADGAIGRPPTHGGPDTP